jgi:hypothetical protein
MLSWIIDLFMMILWFVEIVVSARKSTSVVSCTILLKEGTLGFNHGLLKQQMSTLKK